LPLRTRSVSGKGLLDIGVGIGAVDLVHVDTVGLEAAQRVLDGRDDPPPGGTLLVRVGTHGAAELRREDHVVPAALESPADNLLRVSVRVSGVDQVDACVERLADDPDRVLGVGVADLSGEHERAEPVRADLDACPAEVSVPHEGSPAVRVTCAEPAEGDGQHALTASRPD
jgi:hypothetical protein